MKSNRNENPRLENRTSQKGHRENSISEKGTRENRAFQKGHPSVWLGILACLTVCMLITGCLAGSAGAESYSGGTIRLIRFSGEVGIRDEAGNDRFVMENVRFGSGETLWTGPEAAASVNLDASKIVTLDQKTSVGFRAEGNAMKMSLQEGALFLDVSEKLDENESLEIETSTMTIGIRGTIVFVKENGASEDVRSQLGVLEGTALVTVAAADGKTAELSIGAGTTLEIQENAAVARKIESEDLEGFVRETVSGDEQVLRRVEEACPGLLSGEAADRDPWAADGDWTWTSPVTFVAQSASKCMTGRP